MIIKNRLQQAFTMFEMLIVVMLIGVIMAFVLPRIMKYAGKAGEAELKMKVGALKEALVEYKMEFGMFPSTREGLGALVSNKRPNAEAFKNAEKAGKWPFVDEKNLADKAGNDFQYHCPPEKFKGKYKHFEIIYLGPSGQEGDEQAFDDGQ